MEGVIIANGYTGRPNSPNRGAIVMQIQSSEILAHELGHYFGLAHTFAGGTVVTDPNHPENVQYVHHPTDPENNPVLLSTGSFSCWQTGDFICDTRADPRCSFTNCSTIDVCLDYYDPLGMAYDPYPDLIMGPNTGCWTRFTNEQNQRMVTLYTGHPDWLFLYDPFIPTCQSLTSDAGFVRRNCKDILTLGGMPALDITPIEDVDVPLRDNNSQACGPTPITNQIGRYVTHNCVYPTYNGSGLLSILPDKNYASNPLNGVSTFDLVLISRHILGLEPFSSPFQLIAADANNSASVTTFDIVEIRKVILGITTGMPAGSWRYVPEYSFNNQTFSNEFYNDENLTLPGEQPNPFNAVWTNPDETNGQQRIYGTGAPVSPNATSWMDHVSINPDATTAQEVEPWSLWGVKTGDVNCSSDVDDEVPPPPSDEIFLTTSHALLPTNQEFTLQIRVLGNTPVSAWQFGIEFDEDYLQILEVLQGNSSETFSLDNFGLTQTSTGEFRALNYEPTGAVTNLYNKILFKIRVKALQPIATVSQHFRLKNRILEYKFYEADGGEIENMDLQLEVVGGALGMAGGIGGTKSTALTEAYRLSAYPVPFTSEVVFDFYLPEDEQVRLFLYDGFGRLVSQNNSPLYKGANSITLNDLANQTAGLYWYLFEAGGQSLYGKLIKN